MTTIAVAKESRPTVARSIWVGAVLAVGVPVAAFWFFVLEDVSVNHPERRFEFNRQHYVDQIVQLPETGVPRLMAFDFGSTGGTAVANIFYTLVYDESDEIGLPPAQRSLEWRQRACSVSSMQACLTQKSDPQRYVVEVKSMGSHFYLITEIYQ
ncbi:MAG: hypothetical protein K2Y71_07025 [Xanthobacteraceae bacterium]|nr:hypothetical protein [Xanthobacteraceae bacterium]